MKLGILGTEMIVKEFLSIVSKQEDGTSDLACRELKNKKFEKGEKSLT